MIPESITIHEGPWPARVSEILIKFGILRWQTLKRLYGGKPAALANRVPKTSAEQWEEWLAQLPDVPAMKTAPRAMGLMPRPDIREGTKPAKEAPDDNAKDESGVG